MIYRQKEIILSKVTPEQAASLTSNCSEVTHYCGGKKGFYAILWCNKKGETIVADGLTTLEAVVNVHNKLIRINNKWD